MESMYIRKEKISWLYKKNQDPCFCTQMGINLQSRLNFNDSVGSSLRSFRKPLSIYLYYPVGQGSLVLPCSYGRYLYNNSTCLFLSASPSVSFWFLLHDPFCIPLQLTLGADSFFPSTPYTTSFFYTNPRVLFLVPWLLPLDHFTLLCCLRQCSLQLYILCFLIRDSLAPPPILSSPYFPYFFLLAKIPGACMATWKQGRRSWWRDVERMGNWGKKNKAGRSEWSIT